MIHTNVVYFLIAITAVAGGVLGYYATSNTPQQSHVVQENESIDMPQQPTRSSSAGYQTTEKTEENEMASNSQKDEPNEPGDEKPSHVFAGDILSKLEDGSTQTPGERYRVAVRNDWGGAPKGGVEGEVTVNFVEEEPLVRANGNGLHYVFYTKWNQERGWYDLMRLSIYIND